jgi:universal stress protein A
MSFKRILCAVDFSQDSLNALRVSVEMARLHCGSLHLFHVIEAQPAAPAEVVVELIQEANDAMEGLVRSSRTSLTGLDVTAEVTSGRAFVEIVSHARHWKADLIVLGSKGTTSLEEIIVGGTAENVMKEATCSTLIARRNKKHDRAIET